MASAAYLAAAGATTMAAPTASKGMGLLSAGEEGVREAEPSTGAGDPPPPQMVALVFRPFTGKPFPAYPTAARCTVAMRRNLGIPSTWAMGLSKGVPSASNSFLLASRYSSATSTTTAALKAALWTGPSSGTKSR